MQQLLCIFTARNAERGKAAVGGLQNQHFNVEYLNLDVTDVGTIK